MTADSRLAHPVDTSIAEKRQSEPPRLGEKGSNSFNYASRILTIASGVFGGFESQEVMNLSEVPIKNLIRMYHIDGQIAGLYNLYKLPIVATDFEVYPKDDRSKSEGDFIRQTLKEPAHSGGMTTSMRYLKSDLAMGAITGFRAYEKVFDQRGGKIVLQKLAPRNPETITLVQDKTGGFNGFVQRFITPDPDGRSEVVIERDYALLYTNNKEDNPLYGKSDFLAAYYHYDKLHKLYYVAHMAFQALVLPPRVGTIPQTATDQTEIDAFFNAIQRLGFDTAITIKEGYSVDSFGTDRPGMNFMELIEHHVGQISKSVLAPFMDLGSGKGRGSFALSKDLSAIWIMSTEGKIKDIDDHFNAYVIPQLVDYNFASRKYPEMKHKGLSTENKDAIISVYTKLQAAPQNQASPEFMLGLEEELAKYLEIPEIDYAAIRVQRQKDIEDQRAAQKQAQNGAVAGLMDTLTMDREGNVSLTDKSWDLIKELSKERQDAIATAIQEGRIQTPKALPAPEGGVSAA